MGLDEWIAPTAGESGVWELGSCGGAFLGAGFE